MHLRGRGTDRRVTGDEWRTLPQSETPQYHGVPGVALRLLGLERGNAGRPRRSPTDRGLGSGVANITRDSKATPDKLAGIAPPTSLGIESLGTFGRSQRLGLPTELGSERLQRPRASAERDTCPNQRPPEHKERMTSSCWCPRPLPPKSLRQATNSVELGISQPIRYTNNALSEAETGRRR